MKCSGLWLVVLLQFEFTRWGNANHFKALLINVLRDFTYGCTSPSPPQECPIRMEPDQYGLEPEKDARIGEATSEKGWISGLQSTKGQSNWSVMACFWHQTGFQPKNERSGVFQDNFFNRSVYRKADRLLDFMMNNSSSNVSPTSKNRWWNWCNTSTGKYLFWFSMSFQQNRKPY